VYLVLEFTVYSFEQDKTQFLDPTVFCIVIRELEVKLACPFLQHHCRQSRSILTILHMNRLSSPEHARH
jgi:hypothetical protein